MCIASGKKAPADDQSDVYDVMSFGFDELVALADSRGSEDLESCLRRAMGQFSCMAFECSLSCYCLMLRDESAARRMFPCYIVAAFFLRIFDFIRNGGDVRLMRIRASVAVACLCPARRLNVSNAHIARELSLSEPDFCQRKRRFRIMMKNAFMNGAVCSEWLCAESLWLLWMKSHFDSQNTVFCE